LRNPRAIAVKMIHTRDRGISFFHPKFINWSYRMRGRLALTHTKKSTINHVLRRNQNVGSIHCKTVGPKTGPAHPPRKRVVVSAAMLKTLMY